MLDRIGELPHERITLAWNLECAGRAMCDSALVSVRSQRVEQTGFNCEPSGGSQTAPGRAEALHASLGRRTRKSDCDKLIAIEPETFFD